MGNPPFVGYAYQSAAQKEDMKKILGEFGKNLDYVCCWYKKAFDLIKGTETKCALVSTNSITQGEQVAALWKPLFEKGLQIDFAYRTFRWDSESFLKAHVHCVIVGFSDCHADSSRLTAPLSNNDLKASALAVPNPCGKFIFDENGEPHEAKNINGYLIDAPNVCIEKRATPICDVSLMNKGSQPTDGGNLIIEADEIDDFLKKEPNAKKWIRLFQGSEEFINGKKRYCLWLEGANPSELKKCPLVMERIENVRKMRLASTKEATRKWAEMPTLFTEIRQPKSDYLLFPRVSSETRKYIPIGFVNADVIASDASLVVPNATLYEFGILTSSVHNAWMRAVCGRLEMRYRYSNTIVYNNFVWPNFRGQETGDRGQMSSGEKQNELSPVSLPLTPVIQTAQAILDARAKYPDCSLADLYDENTMPPELRHAHNENDKAVMQAYGFSTKMTEAEIVARLMLLHQRCKRQ